MRSRVLARRQLLLLLVLDNCEHAIVPAGLSARLLPRLMLRGFWRRAGSPLRVAGRPGTS
jgi:hypothetical protein